MGIRYLFYLLVAISRDESRLTVELGESWFEPHLRAYLPHLTEGLQLNSGTSLG